MQSWLAWWAAALAVVLVVSACGPSAPDSGAPEPELTDLSLEQLTARLVDLHQRSRRKPDATLERELAQVATLRAPLLRQVAREDGQRARRNVLPDYVQISLPSAVQKLVEHRAKSTGK